MIRIGQSRDVHRFKEGTDKPLVLGAVLISGEVSVEAHSDGDALIHAIVEAIIGALGMGDLGTLYPDSSSKYKDIESSYFLKDIKRILEMKNYRIGNIDTTIHLEKPLLKKYIPLMKENIASCLGIDKQLINIKATRGEKIGFVGRCEGVEAECVVLILKKEEPVFRKL